MYRRFTAKFFTPAWVGGNLEDALGLSNCFQHRSHSGRGRGKDFEDESFARGWGNESRTRRGEIKFLLLELLSEHPSHGYDLIKKMEVRYGGLRHLSPGSVYPTLQMLEDGGYLTSQPEDGKRVYTITDEGRKLLSTRVEKEDEGSPRDAFKKFVKGKPQELLELRNAAGELASAIMHVAQSGNVERINKVRELVEQVKREIYAILAEK